MNHQGKKIDTFFISRTIGVEEQGNYVEIPFDMPANVEYIQVSYRVETGGDSKAIIDLGIRDESKVRGWSGGARKEFRLGLESATPGYMPGPLHPGNWAVLHNAYKVPEEGCTVTVAIELHYCGFRWLKGDLHTHSVHSDGQFTLEENAAIMAELGCEFIAMTDHNTVSQNAAYPRNTDIVMIPGMEFTTNYGHSNFLGVAEPIDDFRVMNQENVTDKISQARSRGAFIVVNHPHCEYCPWLWSMEMDFDAVEIWNGPWTARNERALQWWHEQLVAGKRLVAVGGSDTHRPDLYVKHAMPCTWVYAETATPSGILEAVGKGHVFITYSPEGPFIELTCGSSMMGDAVVRWTEITLVRLQVSHLREGDQVKVISNHGIVEDTCALTKDTELDIELHADEEGLLFYRVEVWRYHAEVDDRLLIAVTNPMYFGG